MPQPNRRPNILFLLTDDHRWDALGCMGNPIIRTPHIDSLSRQGVTFLNHFVTTAICMCSRASIFSGQYARTHGIWDFAKPFTAPQFANTYPARFRSAGYRTGFIGKYGVGNAMPEKEFDFWRGFPGQGRYLQPGKPHLTELMGDQALEFLNQKSTDPFCLSISFKAPHVQDEDPRQFVYDPQHADWYRDVPIPYPKTADSRDIERFPLSVQRSENRRRWAVRFATPALYQESVRSYYRLITEVDDVVGRLRAQLAQSGQADNTVIVFTGDNGFYLAEHGLAGKWFMHEESIRVPMIIYDPRLPANLPNRRRNQMTLNIDVAPTLLDFAGLETPPMMQGRSLAPLVRGESPRWRREWFYEHLVANEWIPQTQGVRTERWKYCRFIQESPVFEELYDLENDRFEERNRARDASYSELTTSLRQRSDEWIAHLKQFAPATPWREPAFA